MDRFFSSKNIRRYRKLIGSTIKTSERQRILGLLVNEIAAFKDECRAPVRRKSDYERPFLASPMTSNHV
jgi:hypothetical protein